MSIEEEALSKGLSWPWTPHCALFGVGLRTVPWPSALSYTKCIGQVISAELILGGGAFYPALPLPISCDTALALERQALKCLRFARTQLSYFEQNYLFLSIFFKWTSVFVHILNEIRVQIHKITRFCPYFCSNAQNYPFWSIFLFRWPKLSVLLHFWIFFSEKQHFYVICVKWTIFPKSIDIIV